MGFQSQAGQVGFRTQAAAGTFSDPGSGGVFMRTRSGALAANRELLIPDPEIGGGRDVPDAYLGAVSFSGDFEFYARTNSLATLLFGAFGTKVSSSIASDGAHSHTITPTDSNLPWLSVEEAVGNGFEVFRYVDTKVNTLSFEAEANGYLQGTVGLIAREQTAGHTRTASPAWDTNPMLVGTNIVATYGGVQLPAKSFTLELNNNLEDDDFRLGSFFLGDVTEKRRELTMGFALRPEDISTGVRRCTARSARPSRAASSARKRWSSPSSPTSRRARAATSTRSRSRSRARRSSPSGSIPAVTTSSSTTSRSGHCARTRPTRSSRWRSRTRWRRSSDRTPAERHGGRPQAGPPSRTTRTDQRPQEGQQMSDTQQQEHAAAIEANMVAAGVSPTEDVYEDYFGFDDNRTVTLPDGKSFVEFKVMNEGDRKKYLNAQNKKVTIRKGSGDAEMELSPGNEQATTSSSSPSPDGTCTGAVSPCRSTGGTSSSSSRREPEDHRHHPPRGHARAPVAAG
jgi:hypothetical protein